MDVEKLKPVQCSSISMRLEEEREREAKRRAEEAEEWRRFRYGDGNEEDDKHDYDDDYEEAGEEDQKPFVFTSVEELITTRKAEVQEEAKLKRREGMRLIEEQNSALPGSWAAVQIFPAEIWKLILENLEDPVDLDAVWNTCTLFQDLLAERRSRDILFPLAFRVPELSNLINRPELRLVCKSWKNSVDRIYEVDVDQKQEQRRFTISLMQYLHPSGRARERMDKLMSNFDPTQSNGAKQFFIRSLPLDLVIRKSSISAMRGRGRLLGQVMQPIQPSVTALLGKITSFLEVVGSQILSFTFTAEDLQVLRKYGVSHSKVYTLLHQWVSFMKNLEVLVIQIKGLYPQRIQAGTGLKETLQSTPFPTLSKLKSLHFGRPTEAWGDTELGENNHITLIYEAILNANREVKELFITDVDWRPKIFDSLKIESANFTEKDSSPRPFLLTGLPYYYNLTWNLTKVNLQFPNASTLDANSVFRFFENFPCLSHINMVSGPLVGKGGYLDLPNLTYFKYEFYSEFVPNGKCYRSVDFLLPCKKLEHLYWKVLYDSEADIRYHCQKKMVFDEVINFRGALATLYSSNIWDIFPRLKYVMVKGYESSFYASDPEAVPEIRRKLRRHSPFANRGHMVYERMKRDLPEPAAAADPSP